MPSGCVATVVAAEAAAAVAVSNSECVLSIVEETALEAAGHEEGNFDFVTVELVHLDELGNWPLDSPSL